MLHFGRVKVLHKAQNKRGSQTAKAIKTADSKQVNQLQSD